MATGEKMKNKDIVKTKKGIGKNGENCIKNGEKDIKIHLIGL